MSHVLRAKRFVLLASARLPIWVCLFAALGGCRTARDNQIDLLERELRTQEDYIYELEDYVMEYSEKLRQARCAGPIVYSKSAPTTVKKKSAGSVMKQPARDVKPLLLDEEMPPLDDAMDKAFDEPLDATPLTPPLDQEPIDPEDMEVPEIELQFSEPVGQDGAALEAPPVHMAAYDDAGEPQRLFIPDPANFNEPEVPAAQPEIEHAAHPAEAIQITQLFHGDGVDADLTSLLTVVEALDADREPTDLAGSVSLMLMVTSGESPQRLKRWDFTAEETTAAWQSSDLGDGWHFELPLEGTVLPEGEIELWARIVVEDGGKLLTQVAFDAADLTEVGAPTTPEITPSNSAPTLAFSFESTTWQRSPHTNGVTSTGFATTVGGNQWSAGSTQQTPRVAGRSTTRSDSGWKRSSRTR